MKKITLLLMLLSTMAFSQNFKIQKTDSIKENQIFKDVKNDTVKVFILYKTKLIEADKVVKRIECIFDYNDKLKGSVFNKTSHYLFEGKRIDTKDVIYEKEKHEDLYIIDGYSLSPTFNYLAE